MSNKKLLNESTVRRFMGLANLAPLSESFLETQVNEEEEVNEDEVKEGEEVVEEAASVEEAETVEESTDKGVTEEEVKAEGLIPVTEDDEEEIEDIEAHDDADDAARDMGDADLDMMDAADDLEAAEADGDIATRAEQILGDLAALINQAAGSDIVTVTTSGGEEEADLEADAAMDLDAATLDMDGAVDVEETEPEEEEDLMQETGAKLTGASRGDKSKTKPGKDPLDYTKNESKSKKSSVDALVAEITSKVISRLNK